jgi:hypothetical protein
MKTLPPPPPRRRSIVRETLEQLNPGDAFHATAAWHVRSAYEHARLLGFKITVNNQTTGGWKVCRTK